MKRLSIGLTIVGSAGLLTAVVLTIIEGVKYRVREEQGVDPIWAPDWVAVATTVGLSIFMAAAIALGVIGALALARQRPNR